MNIIGISAGGYHESAVCLVQDGQLLFACAEERLSRIKQDSGFPKLALQAALDFAHLRAGDIDHVAFSFPHPWQSHRHDLKLFARGARALSLNNLEKWAVGLAVGVRHGGGILDYRRLFGQPKGGFHLIEHHLAHALSSYCLSGFDEAAVLVVDGRGAEEATTLWQARGDQVARLETFDYPNSLGLFYAAITEQLGFQPFSDEWKVMGLAAYGKPTVDLAKIIRADHDNYWVDGALLLNCQGTARARFESIVGPRRAEGEELSQRHRDLARSAQDACEQTMLALLRRVSQKTGARRLCLAGGVALNCKANGELLRAGLIDEIYVQPAAGDDGACIGAALAVYQRLGQALPRHAVGHSYLGSQFADADIEATLRTYKIPYRKVAQPARHAAQLLAQNHLLGWFQGRMEFGPRSLGNRSILAHPGFKENTDRVNQAVKFREEWRPFAPSVLAGKAPAYFQMAQASPYMILSFWAEPKRAQEIAAVVHVDGSSRLHTVERKVSPLYHELIAEFDARTGLPLVLNTSFNLKGEAIVASPKDAIQTFYTSGLDDLVIGSFAVSKNPLSEVLG